MAAGAGLAAIAAYYNVSVSSVKQRQKADGTLTNDIVLTEEPKDHLGTLKMTALGDGYKIVAGPILHTCMMTLVRIFSVGVSGGVVIDPTDPEALSDGHHAANGDRTDPRYGGNCEPDDFDQLRQAQYDSCKDPANGAQTLGGCFPGMSPLGRADRLIQLTRCLDARKDVANQCFAGGNDGHRQQINQVKGMILGCGGTPP
jgi:hypothetical protein